MAEDKSTKPSARSDASAQAHSIGVNQTDAGGVKTGEQPGAATGESERVATARAIVAQADAGKERFVGKDGRLPHILTSALEVRRGDKIYTIPHGTVVTETDLTDEEFDHALASGIVREASVADMRAAEAKKQQAASDEAAKQARREAVGVAPKSSSGSEPPAGAVLKVDLAESVAMTARANAAREVALAGTRRPMPIGAPVGQPSDDARK